MQSISESRTRTGAASLFIVVFSILLLTIISLSFIKIALRGAKSASESDLSQSAYDSAMSGVEDAKRALAKYVQKGCTPSSTDQFCKRFIEGYNGNDCDIVAKALHDSDSAADEAQLKPGGGTHDSDQAYTCVKITYNTLDYLNRLEQEDGYDIIPLRAVGGGVDSIKVRWFTADDRSDQTPNFNFPSSPTQLLPDKEWENRGLPPVLVVQYSKSGVGNLTDYDINGNAFHTLYLVPASTGSGSGEIAQLDARGDGAAQLAPLVPVRCENDLSANQYACTYEIKLSPDVIPAYSDQYYIKISKRYSAKTTYQVQMLSGGVPVKFAGVQPAVDSNGRANDFFRRVEARLRVPLVGDMPLPHGAVEVAKGDFCKRLSVYDSAQSPDPSCNN